MALCLHSTDICLRVGDIAGEYSIIRSSYKPIEIWNLMIFLKAKWKL